MKWLLTFVVLLFGGYLYSQQQVQQEMYNGPLKIKIIPTKTSYSIQLGILTLNRPKSLKNPSEYVLEDGYLYKGADYRINGINILNMSKKDLSDFGGKPVVIYYRLKKDLNNILKKQDKAPEDYGKEESMMQMRSDWVSPETGFNIGRSTKEKLKKINYYEVYDIVPYSGVNISKADKSVNIEIRNDFDVTMTEIKVTGHYEGGRGKPVPKYISEKYKGLNPGAKMNASLKTGFIENNKWRGRFRLESVIVEFLLHKENQRIEISAY